MPAVSRHDLDIVKELRLRRWAREHHVPPEERGDAWHPVVLDEMRRKDADMLIRARTRTPFNAFVPLAPTVIQRIRRNEETAQPTAVRRNSTGNKRADAPHEPVLPHVVQTAVSEPILAFQGIATIGVN